MEQSEQFFTCPYCWESISMLVDTSAPVQDFIEDCEVCCQPISIHYECHEGEVTQFESSRAQ